MINDQDNNRLQTFASLHWYDETIKFVFNFVAKTSELLLATGIIISTANFLTDGHVMSHNEALSNTWSWIQALAIDSSLGIVFMNAFQAVRSRDKVKAVIFFTLTALLATVAGLVTHFDALSHASGLPVTDKGVSGVIPLWVMTTLRALAVIGFLLSSRLKDVSFSDFHKEWQPGPELSQEPQRGPIVTQQIDYNALASALVTAMQQAGVLEQARIVEVEQEIPSLSTPKVGNPSEEPLEVKLARAYETLKEERAREPNLKSISARDLAKCANVRRSTCSEWLQHHETYALEEETQSLQEVNSFKENRLDA